MQKLITLHTYWDENRRVGRPFIKTVWRLVQFSGPYQRPLLRLDRRKPENIQTFHETQFQTFGASLCPCCVYQSLKIPGLVANLKSLYFPCNPESPLEAAQCISRPDLPLFHTIFNKLTKVFHRLKRGFYNHNLECISALLLNDCLSFVNSFMFQVREFSYNGTVQESMSAQVGIFFIWSSCFLELAFDMVCASFLNCWECSRFHTYVINGANSNDQMFSSTYYNLLQVLLVIYYRWKRIYSPRRSTLVFTHQLNYKPLKIIPCSIIPNKK